MTSAQLSILARRIRDRTFPTLIWMDGGEVKHASYFDRDARKVLDTEPDRVVGTFDHRCTVADLRHALGGMEQEQAA